VTNEDFAAIESALGLVLPAEYRAVMSSQDARWRGGFLYGGLFNTPNVVIRKTLEFLEQCASWGVPRPSSWVVVGTINAGDVMFIDAGEPEPPLRLWNHEVNRVDPHTDTISGFVRTCIELEGGS
jgi:hypothetical protein